MSAHCVAPPADGTRWAERIDALADRSWNEESVHVPDVDAAVAFLRGALRPGDIVLVKASRAAGLERVAAALTAPDDGQQPTREADG